MKTLLERLTEWREHQANKHDYKPDAETWAVEDINNLSNHDLLREMSAALEEMEQERDACK